SFIVLKFWRSCQTEFPELSAKAMRCLALSNYLCESVFSTLAYLKNKYRARLERENDMRRCLPNRHAVWTSPCPDITLTGLPSLHTHPHAHTHARTHARTRTRTRTCRH